MINLEELRKAIELGIDSYGVMGEEIPPVLVEAAAVVALILKPDQLFIERLALEICNHDFACDEHMDDVRKVLAAIVVKEQS